MIASFMDIAPLVVHHREGKAIIVGIRVEFSDKNWFSSHLNLA